MGQKTILYLGANSGIFAEQNFVEIMERLGATPVEVADDELAKHAWLYHRARITHYEDGGVSPTVVVEHNGDCGDLELRLQEERLRVTAQPTLATTQDRLCGCASRSRIGHIHWYNT